ncbi:hypothetical protein HRM2_08240 [Desulforapulum autotrophicum HRM2]|uniref:DUF4352 domain-containing protein n=2 Tax=Desulforapulum autotrophicum TaxID=2296 RepID=C0QJT4_DESAH|nr:hypothetical protein HRM2_08240 [Desulforapulum autotrophicum HRM2]
MLLCLGVITDFAGASINGVYKTDFSEMSLQANGNQVTGTYKYKDGKINADLQGNRLTGTWVQTNARGRLEFVFTDDFSSFMGKWGYDDAALSRIWNGRKTDIQLPESPAPEGSGGIFPDTILDTVEKTTTPPSQNPPVVKEEGVKPGQPEQTEGGEVFLRPGQAAMRDDLEITLLSLKKTNQYINQPKTDHFYAIIRVRVKNLGKEQDSALIFSQLQWKDPKSSISHSFQRTTGVKLDKTRDYELPPGVEGEFEEVYMLPNGMSETQFVLSKGWTKTIAIWLLPIE